MPYRQELPIPKDVETLLHTKQTKIPDEAEIRRVQRRNLGLQSNLDMNVEEMHFSPSQPPNNRIEPCDPGYPQLERVKNSRKQSSLPRADGAANSDSEGAVGEGARGEQRRALGEVAGGVDGLVGVRREAVVGVPHMTVLPDPRSPRCIATAVPETVAKPNQAYVRSEQMCGK